MTGLEYAIRYDVEHDLFHPQNVFSDEYITPTFIEYVRNLEKENAGLKARLPQWHDLREDPNDLPKENKSYWVYIDCQGNKIYRSIVWHGCWLGWDCIPLAWCEEPTFDKE